MSVLSREKFNGVFDTIRAEWDRLKTAIKATYTDWAMVIPSTTKTETWEWADLLVQIREWIGERVLGHIRGQEWTVKNRKYEGSFSLEVDDINDDKLGMLLPKTQELYNGALFHPEKLLEEIALAGFSTACYDGQLFFDADHPALTEDGTTVANLGSDPLDYDSVRKIINEHFMMIPGANGVPLDIEPFALMVGPSQLGIAQSLFGDEKKPNSLTESNQLRNRLKPILNRRFVGAYANYYIVMARFRNSSLTPFIYQKREEPNLVCTAMATNAAFAGMEAQDSIQFMNDIVAFGTDFRGAATFTFWVLAFASTGSGVN